MSTQTTLYCSFCGKSQHEVHKLIAGPSVFVCDECVELCVSILDEEHKSLGLKSCDAVPSSAEIHKLLDRPIRGQEDVKQVLSAVLHRHYQCLADASGQAGSGSSPTNILIGGPSLERGKVARVLERFLAVPFVTVDATELVEIRDPRDVIQCITRKLLDAAHYSVAQAEKGFVYVDDLDQLGHLAGKPRRDLSEVGEAVQKALGDLMSGAVVEVTTSVGTVLSVDTRSLTFVCAGTFLGLSKVTAGRAWNPGQGQDAEGPESSRLEGPVHLSAAEAETLIGFGLLPDLVNCLSVLVALEVSNHSGEPDRE